MHSSTPSSLATAGLAADALPVATEAVRLGPANANAHDLRGRDPRHAGSAGSHPRACSGQPGREPGELPRNLWASVLRQREVRSPKIYLGAAVLVIVVLGACALGAPINYWVLTGAILITVV